MLRMTTGLVAGLMLAAGAAGAAGWGGDDKPASAKAAPAAAQPSLAVIDGLQKAVTDSWATMPMTQRRAIFVTGTPEMYGAYEERPSNVFKPGEKLVTYVEPIGYSWIPAGPDSYTFGLTADFVIKTPDGKILGGQEKFFNASRTGHYKNQEFMVTITLGLTGLAAGSYVVEYTLHDLGGTKASSFQQPFRIAE